MERRKIRTTFLVFIAALLSVTLAFYAVNGDTVRPDAVITNENTTQATTEDPTPSVTSTVTIRSAGDVLIHIPVYQNAQKSDGTYDFSHIFTYSKNIISSCDYFVANLETTLGGTNGRSYSGFPRFNSPDSIIDALKGAGVDCLLTANNHTYDTNGSGVLRTIDVIEKAGLDFTGTRKTTEDKQYFTKKISGIKFGFACYTYETPTSEGRKALNGLLVDTTTAPLINSFNPAKPQTFYDELDSNIKAMKENGAEIIVVYVHWGEEYDPHYPIPLAGGPGQGELFEGIPGEGCPQYHRYFRVSAYAQ